MNTSQCFNKVIHNAILNEMKKFSIKVKENNSILRKAYSMLHEKQKL